jgi:hypothetical protein
MDVLTGFLVGFAATQWFWAVLVIVILLLTTSAINEEGFWAATMSFMLLALAFSKWPAICAFLSSPVIAVTAIIAYFTIGAMWGVFKWKLYVDMVYNICVSNRENFLRYRKLPNDYLQNNPKADVIGHYIEYMRNNIPGKYVPHDINTIEELNNSLVPIASNNSYSIIIWITYWPISAIWFVVSDLFTEIGKAIYRNLAQIFQSVSDSKFKKF